MGVRSWVAATRRPLQHAETGYDRSLHRIGRVKRPAIASPQINSRSTKLAARKNQAFNSLVIDALYQTVRAHWT